MDIACGENRGEDHSGRFEVSQGHILGLCYPFLFFIFQQKNASVIRVPLL